MIAITSAPTTPPAIAAVASLSAGDPPASDVGAMTSKDCPSVVVVAASVTNETDEAEVGGGGETDEISGE